MTKIYNHKYIQTSFKTYLLSLKRLFLFILKKHNNLNLFILREILFSPYKLVKFIQLFDDNQLQAQLEPTDLSSMFCSLECRVPLVSKRLILDYLFENFSNTGFTKKPLRDVLNRYIRNSSIAIQIDKKGFQYNSKRNNKNNIDDLLYSSDQNIRKLALKYLNEEINNINKIIDNNKIIFR